MEDSKIWKIFPQKYRKKRRNKRRIKIRKKARKWGTTLKIWKCR